MNTEFQNPNPSSSRSLALTAWQSLVSGRYRIKSRYDRANKRYLIATPNPQGKLVRVARGEVFDVAVDIDPASKTFGKWVGVLLSETNHLQLWVPPGYAHGFVVISEIADFEYKCTDYYNVSAEVGVLWNDPDIGIDWPIQNPKLSKKDEALPTLAQIRARQ